MKNCPARYYFFVLIILGLQQIFGSPALSQELSIKNEDHTYAALEQVIKEYDLALGKNTFLYSGRIYYDKFSTAGAHQFFTENYWELGKLICEGEKYDSVSLKYDIYNDLLLLENYTELGSSPIILNDKYISEFQLFNHKFVFLEPPADAGLKNGFYDEVYTGKEIEIYSRRIKELDESLQNQRITIDFFVKDRYYLVKNDIFHRIKNKRTVLKLFKDQKNRLKGFIRNEDLDFRNNFEEAVVKTVSYYETIIE